jgi:hypothetical protein
MEDVNAYCNFKFQMDYNTLSFENKLKVNGQYLEEKKINILIAAQGKMVKYIVIINIS